jgi:RNA polymerase-binding transcription factor DksA
MATKKKTAVKAVAKKAVKSAPAKPAAKKITAPAKKVVAKPVAKKAVAKPAPKKVAPAPAKKVVAKPVVKKAIAKAVPKKVAPAKKVTAKPVAKPVAKKAAVVAKPISKKAVPAKKVEVKKPIVKKAVVAPKKVVVAPKKVEVKKTEVPVKKEATKKVAVVEKTAAKPAVIVKPKPAINAIAKNPKDIKIPAAKPVVLPKINTKTARVYQPDFTKSVLDQQKNDPGAPIVKYSDNDLQEFKELIQRKLESAKKELNFLQGLITRKDDTGGDESENRYMTMEDGSLSMEREQLSQMASRQITFIDHLEKALMRIESKTYGVCRVTGKLIDKARLKAVPHATLSIEAKMGIVK